MRQRWQRWRDVNTHRQVIVVLCLSAFLPWESGRLFSEQWNRFSVWYNRNQPIFSLPTTTLPVCFTNQYEKSYYRTPERGPCCSVWNSGNGGRTLPEIHPSSAMFITDVSASRYLFSNSLWWLETQRSADMNISAGTNCVSFQMYHKLDVSPIVLRHTMHQKH